MEQSVSNFWNKPKSLHELAEEIASQISSSPDPFWDSSAAEPFATNESGEGAHGQAGSPRDPSNGQCPNGSKTVQMEVTAHTSGPESTGKAPGHPDYGKTAGRTIAGPGTIAAPPTFKFGTRMYVPGYGWGTVQDRGGVIQGNHLDVWFETVAEARKWGRQMLDVIVCNG
jgi:3D (Asp-Asp-Asp) domain-containing protein